MKKAILKDVGEIEIIDAPEPELNEGEALIVDESLWIMSW